MKSQGILDLECLHVIIEQILGKVSDSALISIEHHVYAN